MKEEFLKYIKNIKKYAKNVDFKVQKKYNI